MDIDHTDVTYLKNPSANTLHGDYQQFLLSLVGLTIIDITGENTNEWRVFTTLIYGNEPSGLIALHRWLTSRNPNELPATNIRIILCSVEAASKNPLFSRTHIPANTSLNRYFNCTISEGNNCLTAEELSENAGTFERATLIKEKINEVSPQAVLDIHNTSGSGPAFAFSQVITPETLSITSFFCDTIILSNMKIGSLIEVDFNCPTIEIKCGASNDEQAHEVAYQGIKQFIACEDLSVIDQQNSVNIMYKPLRMKLKAGVPLNYGNHDEGEDGVTLKSTIEQFNFGSADMGQMLGWVDNTGLDNFELISECNENVISKYFTLRDNQLVVAHPMKILMATTNKETAENDCLFYLVRKPANTNFY